MDRLISVKNALPIVAGVYGKKFGVNVVIGNFDTASMDGNTIRLPAVAHDYQHMDVLWGYLAHEAAHVRYSDMNFFQNYQASQLCRSFLNVIEDGRIELAMGEVFPGTRKTLEACTGFGMSQEACVVPPEAPLERVLFMYAYAYMYSCINGYAVTRRDLADLEAALLERVSQAVLMKAQLILSRVASAASTQDAASIAEALMTMLKEEAENPSKPPSSEGDKGDDSDDSGNTSAGNSGTDAGDDDGASPGSSPSNGAGDTGDGSPDADGNGQDGASAQAGASMGPGADDATSQQNLQQLLAGDGAGSGAFSLHDVVADALDEAADDSYDSVTGEGSAYISGFPNERMAVGDGTGLIAEAKSVSSRIRRDLVAMLQANARTERRTVDRGRKVRGNKLHRLGVGNPNVFRSTTRAKEVDTAVHLLVDLSGSMSGHEAVVAKECGIALASALEGIAGANPAITYFGGGGLDSIKVGLRHGQRLSQAKNHLDSSTWGGTPMAEGMWYAASQLEQTRNEKKMLVVVTDGGPNDPQATRYAADYLARAGYHLLGIGIGSSAIENYIDNSITINGVDDLIGTLFNLVGDALVA